MNVTYKFKRELLDLKYIINPNYVVVMENHSIIHIIYTIQDVKNFIYVTSCTYIHTYQHIYCLLML